MIFGIGCDVCALDHLEKSLSGPHAAAFVRRVYGPAECTALALDTPLPAGHSGAHRLASAAADFAAKEAFLKAAGTGLHGLTAHLSLSHDVGMALAFCILETAPET